MIIQIRIEGLTEKDLEPPESMRLRNKYKRWTLVLAKKKKDKAKDFLLCPLKSGRQD